MFDAQSTVKGHIRAKQNVFIPQVQQSDSILETHSIVEDLRKLEKNEVELAGEVRNKVGRSPVSRHSTQSYILTYLPA